MKRNRLFVGVAIVVIVAVYAVYLFYPYLHPNNPPFENKLDVHMQTPVSTFNPTTADVQDYSSVTVYSENGQKVILNAAEHPLFFEAYWCPHCQRTMVMWNTHRSELKAMPYFVSLGFAKGTSLSEAMRITHQELSTFHMQSVQVYYLLNDSANQFQFPTLAFSYQGHVSLLMGEHTLSVWKRALNQ
jgi:thiol-disulfide isomerase/thioredoxin